MYSKYLLKKISEELKVDLNLLWALIQFESKWSPTIRNPYSSAGGLIQFVDRTSQELGFKNTSDLIQKLPTADLQLKHAVYPYLKKYSPFPTAQSLFMSVFYPSARFWPETKQFPQHIKDLNPGINTPLDYIKFVYKKLSLRYVPHIVYYVIAGILYLTFKKRTGYDTKKK
jgi:hypothetical protein